VVTQPPKLSGVVSSTAQGVGSAVSVWTNVVDIAPGTKPSQTMSEYPIPTFNSDPRRITVGPDGNLWFTEHDANQVAKVTTSGAITEYRLPS
jgi:streptogramin lyase